MDAIIATSAVEKKLPIPLQHAIANFLMSLPNLETQEGQRAFILQAGVDPELRAQLAFGQPVAQFVPILISRLLQYGTLSDGRPALEAVLEAARNWVGLNGQAECNALLQELRLHQPNTTRQSPVLPEFVALNQHPYGEIVIRSFLDHARLAPGERGAYLDVTDVFTGRFPRSDSYWQREIPQRVGAFFNSPQVKNLTPPMLLFFDCHLSIAFLAGQLVNPKYGLPIIPTHRTRTTGYEVWTEPHDSPAGLWAMDISGSIHTDVMVSIAVSNPNAKNVELFRQAVQLEAVPQIHFQPVSGVGPKAIKNGAHAWHLGFELQTLLHRTLPATCERMHLFVSAPVALMYIFGNTLRYVTKTIQLYEFDFEGATKPARYYPSICLPIESV